MAFHASRKTLSSTVETAEFRPAGNVFTKALSIGFAGSITVGAAFGLVYTYKEGFDPTHPVESSENVSVVEQAVTARSCEVINASAKGSDGEFAVVISRRSDTGLDARLYDLPIGFDDGSRDVQYAMAVRATAGSDGTILQSLEVPVVRQNQDQMPTSSYEFMATEPLVEGDRFAINLIGRTTFSQWAFDFETYSSQDCGQLVYLHGDMMIDTNYQRQETIAYTNSDQTR